MENKSPMRCLRR